MPIAQLQERALALGSFTPRARIGKRSLTTRRAQHLQLAPQSLLVLGAGVRVPDQHPSIVSRCQRTVRVLARVRGRLHGAP
jgi:hypothetical protein